MRIEPLGFFFFCYTKCFLLLATCTNLLRNDNEQPLTLQTNTNTSQVDSQRNDAQELKLVTAPRCTPLLRGSRDVDDDGP